MKDNDYQDIKYHQEILFHNVERKGKWYKSEEKPFTWYECSCGQNWD